MTINLLIDSLLLEQKLNSTCRFQGVITDECLWNDHLIYIKISKGVGIICNVKQFFSQRILFLFYNTMVLRCITLFG